MERPQKIIQPGDYCNDFARIDDGLLWETYCGNNYEVEHTPRNPEGKKVAAVYFSDNCLYDIAENNFYQRVIVENHFDWKNADYKRLKKKQNAGILCRGICGVADRKHVEGFPDIVLFGAV